MILLSGDIETNPGPKAISGQSFSICHWNLNSISAHNYTKISPVTAYALVPNVDIICLSVTNFNSETSTDDQNLKISGYYMLLYRSPSQTEDKFQMFKSNSKLNLGASLCDNPFLTVMIGDFNAKSKDWRSTDINSSEGS